MQVTHIHTPKSYMQHATKQAISIGTEINTGKRTAFKNPSEIVLGEINNTNRLIYHSSNPGLDSVTSLLNTANTYLNEMSNAAQELTNLFTQASTQTLSQSVLTTLDAQFQTQIRKLDQIANNASVGPFSPLNGSISTATPLNIYTPTGDAIPITIPNMMNSESPISKPGPNDLQIELPSTILAFQTTMNVPVDNPVNVLQNIKTFCGQNSFLYIVANQINEAFKAGIADDTAHGGLPPNVAYDACLLYLRRVNWNNLLSQQTDVIAAQNLILNPTFSGPGNVLQDCIDNIVTLATTQDAMLYTAINVSIAPPLPAIAPFIPTKYVVQASNMLSIASPDYFAVVGARLKSTKLYIASAQCEVNQQIKVIEGLRARYAAAADLYGESADSYLKTDILKASIQLNDIMISQSLVIEATTGVHAKLTKTISDAVTYILRKQ
jgi:hypothetical protein